MTTTPCPRPDKLAFDTEEECRARYTALLVTDPTMGVYPCSCGKWHAGRHHRNRAENAMKSTPLIRTGFNVPVQSEPVRRAPQRRAERHAPTSTRSLKVHPTVWKMALQRANGEPSRIEVISATQVEIHNDANWRKAG